MRLTISRTKGLLLFTLLTCLLVPCGAGLAAEPIQIWTTDIGLNLTPMVVSTDSSDNIIVYSAYYHGYYHDGRLTKLSPSGALIWSVEIPGMTPEDMGVDKNDNILIAGRTDGSAYPSYPGTVVKFDRNASELWRKDFANRPQAVTVQPDGSVLVCEYIEAEGPRLSKLNEAGNVIWSVREALPVNSNFLHPLKILVDYAGVISVVHWTSIYRWWGSNYVITYDQSGMKLTETRGNGYPTDAVLSPDDAVTISAWTYCGSGCYYSLLGTPGAMSYIGYPEQFFSLVYSSAGKVVVGVYNQTSKSSFLRKLGGDWEYPLLDLFTNDLAVDSQGSIIVAGYHYPSSIMGSVMKLTDAASIENTLTTVGEMVLSGEIISAGIANSFTSTLENALAANGRGNQESATNMLEAFINKVEAQSGKNINPSSAERLIEAARQVIANLGIVNEKP